MPTADWKVLGFGIAAAYAASVWVCYRTLREENASGDRGLVAVLGGITVLFVNFAIAFPGCATAEAIATSLK